MNLEGLDCWDDYPMEHGCICGNDCPPPPLPLDPLPWVGMTDQGPFRSSTHSTLREETDAFKPRPGYSQNPEDYA